MRQHPYSDLADTQFWSTGVTSPVNTQSRLSINPLISSLSKDDRVASGGSCFAQYIGKELLTRQYHYLRSELSDDRIESFGLGNIYTVAQLRQWLEFATGRRLWAEESTFENNHQWYDYLLPHRQPHNSRNALLEHRNTIKDEMLEHLGATDVFIFTIGLTETWRNSGNDIYPACPGTVIGTFDEEKHHFHNCTYEEILTDLDAIERILITIRPDIRLVYTVSPVPLTATASDDHVLTATMFSKSVIRAAVGTHCTRSIRATYFPSYELINHPLQNDLRFSENLRTITEQGVSYVMNHAFDSHNATSVQQHDAIDITANSSYQEAICDEELLDNYRKSARRTSHNASIVLIGDSHMGKMATGFESMRVDVIGGMVMNGSGFTDEQFSLSDEHIFTPLESDTSSEIWAGIYEQLASLDGDCHILSNIGFQTHRTINSICNKLDNPVLTQTDIRHYFEHYYKNQLQILTTLTGFGTVWLVEDPNFYSFINTSAPSLTCRDKNFHQYCSVLRQIIEPFGIGYLNPCDTVLQYQFSQTGSVEGVVGPDGFHGSPTYYALCADLLLTQLNERKMQAC